LEKERHNSAHLSVHHWRPRFFKIIATLSIVTILLPIRHALGDTYPARWFLLINNFLIKKQTDRAIQLVENAARAGLNGVIVSDSKFMTLEKYHLDNPLSNYYHNLHRFLLACQKNQIEVIPYLRVVSRAEGILAYDANLAAGYEVRNAVFEVNNNVARIIPDSKISLANASFEQSEGDRLLGWEYQDRPGMATVIDDNIKRTGKHSVRLEPKAADKYGHCRLNQVVRVTSYRRYLVSVWLKTKNLNPEKRFNIFIKANTPTGWRNLTFDSYAIHDVK